MVGVVFVFVREDASDVDALADVFDRAGYSIEDDASDALSVVVWSRSAMRCNAFRAAIERAAQRGPVVVASLIATPPQDLASVAPVVDISAWDGRSDASLDQLFYVVFDAIHPVRANVIALPGPTLPIVAPPQLTNAATEPVSRKRTAWETPIPTKLLRPVHAEAVEPPPQPKLGAPSPRRDFRRLATPSHGRAHAALAFAVVALVASAGFALNALATTHAAPRAHVSVTHELDMGGLSLASVSAEAVGLADAAPVEQPRLFEPGQQVGHAGLEPPSARSTRAGAPMS